ncbi:MAG: substrate binding domain-containing protein, partial [Pseudoxanthomonas sp.]
RIGNLPDSNLVARRLGSLRTQVYAGTSYIAKHGEPLHPDDLQHHRTMAMPKHRHGNSYQWTLNDGVSDRDFAVNPILVANDPAALKGALLCGEGVMIAADVMVRPFVEMGHVQRVLAGWIGGEYELNAVFPRGHTQSPKVRAFVDFLLERLNLDIDYMSAHCPLMMAQEAERAKEDTEAEETAAVGLRILEAAVPS